jgi:hypothetical protein
MALSLWLSGMDRSCAAMIDPVLDKPHTTGILGGCLKLQEISPSVCQVSLGIGLDDRGNACSIAFMACQSVSAMMMRNTCKAGCPITIILNALI